MAPWRPSRLALVPFLVCALAAATEIPVAVPAGSAVAELYPLRKDPHGSQGALALVTDQRLNLGNRRAMQDWYMFGFADPPPVTPPVTVRALADAELRLVDASGTIVSSLPLATPFAALRAVALNGSQLWDFVLETSQGGFGQFTGTYAKPLVVQGGALRMLSATDAAGVAEEIVLVRAPKTDWRMVPAARGQGSEIFQVMCRPAEGAGDAFGEDYITYRQEGGLWRKLQRSARGYCVWPDGFPSFSAFP